MPVFVVGRVIDDPWLVASAGWWLREFKQSHKSRRYLIKLMISEPRHISGCCCTSLEDRIAMEGWRRAKFKEVAHLSFLIASTTTVVGHAG